MTRETFEIVGVLLVYLVVLHGVLTFWERRPSRPPRAASSGEGVREP